MLHIQNVGTLRYIQNIQAQAYRKHQKQKTILCVCVLGGGGGKKLAERGRTQFIGFLLSVTDGYLLGVHVVRKCYANLLGRGLR
jgi:hypothetical protein